MRPVVSITFFTANSVPTAYGSAPEPASWRMVRRSSGNPKIVSNAMMKPGSRTEWTCVAADGRAAHLLRPVGLVDRHSESRLGNIAQALGELLHGAAGRIDLRSLGVVDDLPRRQVPRGEQREVLRQRAVIEKFPAATTPRPRATASRSISA